MYSFLLQRNGCLLNVITKKKCTVTTPEVKTVVLLAYYIIFLTTSSVFIGKGIENVRLFRENLFAYFICQSLGNDPACYIFQEEYHKYQQPHLTSAVFVMMGLINWINLIFVVQIQDLKIVLSRISAKVHSFYGTSTQLTFTSDSLSKTTHSTENSV